ncbi:Trigger factor [Hartmannibacter diazotrophicus]|uniref:Trigger factor n=1 Tax=Hartmannibacter diazotrophicus TaxID=1482074 RepID=A0A2C9D8F6_9HYPH|nr:trigger factor [Hartmannibacter diazotrophicus]SON56031.1 Trigger factor [Hartmannibacter diazotrophicus]
MQVTEKVSDGLKRQLEIVVPASELADKLDTYLNDLKGRVQLKGFRPGKVPLGHVKKLYGKSAMAEIVNTTIGETTSEALKERGEKSAIQPAIDLADEEAEKVLDGGVDLAFSMSYEIIPEFEVASIEGITIERPIADVSDEEVEEQLKKIAEGSVTYEPRAEGAAAENGDRVKLSYLGKVDGEPFQGGADDEAYLTLGSGRFIPGFEEQLVGAKVGDKKIIEVTFPEDYPAPDLKGKAATFDIEVFEVAAPNEMVLDDAFAATLGIESIDKLKELIRDQIQSQYGAQTRQKVKRQLLDALDGLYSFDLPPTLVQQEFDIIWQQVSQDMQNAGKTFEDEDTTEEKAREEYTKIAERRVRLGLVLSKIGEEAEVKVNEQELQRALIQRAQQFPGQEREVIEYYRKDAQALASLQAPVFEEKVVDHLLSQVTVTDKTVAKDELFADEEEEAAAV